MIVVLHARDAGFAQNIDEMAAVLGTVCSAAAYE